LLAKAGDVDFLRSVAEAVVQLLMETDVERLGARIGDLASLHFAYQEIVEVAVKEAVGNEGGRAIVE
jgi:hypothetical protein